MLRAIASRSAQFAANFYASVSYSLASGGVVQWSSTANPTGPYDVVLARDGPGVLAQRNGTNPQALRVYGTETGGRYLQLSHNSIDGVITTSFGGLLLGAVGVAVFGFTTTQFYPTVNGAYDIGLSGAGLRRIYFDYTNTSTIGAVTINKAAGRVNVAAGGLSIVVTNSLVTAASKVFCTIAQNDATAVLKNVVPAAGVFTINLTVAATANCAIDFFVVNAD